jgi:hypothetical protein
MHAYYFHFSPQYHVYQHFLYLSPFTLRSSMLRVIEVPSYAIDFITCRVLCILRTLVKKVLSLLQHCYTLKLSHHNIQ